MIKCYDKLCQCGCGEKIKIKRHHKWMGIPRFILGHHSQGERHPMYGKKGKDSPNYKERLKKICEYCKNNFFVIPFYSHQKFCSKKCHNYSRRGKNNPKISETQKRLFKEGKLKVWNKGLTKDTDERVKKIFEDLDNRGYPYVKRGKDHYLYKEKIKLICQECKKDFFVKPRYKNRKFCSQICMHKFFIGENNPFYGKKSWAKGLTKETDERVKRLSEYNKGKERQKSTKLKISKFFKDKTWEELYGEDRAKKMGLKISKSLKKYFRENPKEMLRMKEMRARAILPKKDTLIEVKIQNFLKKLNIEFFTHQYMKIEHGYQCDIYIPSKNLIIECDGEFIHCNPLKYSSDFVRFPNYKKITTAQEIWDRDRIRTKELQEAGFKVLRLWEHEIRVMKLEDFENKLEFIK